MGSAVVAWRVISNGYRMLNINNCRANVLLVDCFKRLLDKTYDSGKWTIVLKQYDGGGDIFFAEVLFKLLQFQAITVN